MKRAGYLLAKRPGEPDLGSNSVCLINPLYTSLVVVFLYGKTQASSNLSELSSIGYYRKFNSNVIALEMSPSSPFNFNLFILTLERFIGGERRGISREKNSANDWRTQALIQFRSEEPTPQQLEFGPAKSERGGFSRYSGCVKPPEASQTEAKGNYPEG